MPSLALGFRNGGGARYRSSTLIPLYSSSTTLRRKETDWWCLSSYFLLFSYFLGAAFFFSSELVRAAFVGQTPSEWPSAHRVNQKLCTGPALFCAAVKPDSRPSRLDPATFASFFEKLKAKKVSPARSLWSSKPRTIGTSSET